MKQILFILIFVMAFLENVSSQVSLYNDYEIKQAIDFYNFNVFEKEKFSRVNQKTEITGSPYLIDEFIEGSIFTTSKTRYQSIPLRYNIYSGQVEFKGADGQPYAITVPEILEKVEFDKYSLEYIPYFESKKINRGFFTVLANGDISLYARQKVIYEPASPPLPFKAPTFNRFTRKSDEYFIRKGLEPAKQILNMNDLTELCADEQERIKAFIKKNKVKTNRPESLKKLVNYYNSL